MRKYTILTFFIFWTHMFGQNVSPLLFIDCKSAIQELKNNSNKIQIVEKYDWISILLLDSSEIMTIKKLNPYLITEYEDFALGLKLKSKYKSYPTKQEDIKRIFIDNSLKNQLLISLYNSENTYIKYPVYIKDNKVVFDIYLGTWFATYFAKLEAGEFSFVKLSETIE